MLLIQVGKRLVRTSEIRMDSYPTVKSISGEDKLDKLDKQSQIHAHQGRIQKLKDEGKII